MTEQISETIDKATEHVHEGPSASELAELVVAAIGWHLIDKHPPKGLTVVGKKTPKAHTLHEVYWTGRAWKYVDNPMMKCSITVWAYVPKNLED